MKERAFRGIGVVLWLVTLLVAIGVHAAPVTLARLPGLAAADPAIRFSPPSSTADPGGMLVIDVVVDNVVDLGGYEFTVTFDPGVVQVQNVTLGPFLGSTGRTTAPLGPNIDHAAGSFEFGAFSFGTAAGPNGSGIVAQVTLQAMAPGSSSLTFTAAQLTNTQIPIIMVNPIVTSGSVTVTGPTPTPTSLRRWVYLPLLRKGVP